MTKQEACERIKKLKDEINRHRYQYHVLDRSEISDSAHDSLKHELAELDTGEAECAHIAAGAAGDCTTILQPYR